MKRKNVYEKSRTEKNEDDKERKKGWVWPSKTMTKLRDGFKIQ